MSDGRSSSGKKRAKKGQKKDKRRNKKRERRGYRPPTHNTNKEINYDSSKDDPTYVDSGESEDELEDRSTKRRRVGKVARKRTPKRRDDDKERSTKRCKSDTRRKDENVEMMQPVERKREANLGEYTKKLREETRGSIVTVGTIKMTRIRPTTYPKSW